MPETQEPIELEKLDASDRTNQHHHQDTVSSIASSDTQFVLNTKAQWSLWLTRLALLGIILILVAAAILTTLFITLNAGTESVDYTSSQYRIATLSSLSKSAQQTYNGSAQIAESLAKYTSLNPSCGPNMSYDTTLSLMKTTIFAVQKSYNLVGTFVMLENGIVIFLSGSGVPTSAVSTSASLQFLSQQQYQPVDPQQVSHFYTYQLAYYNSTLTRVLSNRILIPDTRLTTGYRQTIATGKTLLTDNAPTGNPPSNMVLAPLMCGGQTVGVIGSIASAQLLVTVPTLPGYVGAILDGIRNGYPAWMYIMNDAGTLYAVNGTYRLSSNRNFNLTQQLVTLIPAWTYRDSVVAATSLQVLAGLQNSGKSFWKGSMTVNGSDILVDALLSEYLNARIITVLVLSRDTFYKNLDTSRSVLTWALCVLGAVIFVLGVFISWSFTLNYKSDLIAQQKLHTKNIQYLRAKATAESAINAKSLFLANMSHEIRTPLTGIMGTVELLREDDENLSQEHRDKLQLIDECSVSLMQVLSDVLDISKIEASMLILDPSEFHLLHELTTVVNTFAAAADRKKLELTLDIDSSVPILWIADCARVRQILTNVLSNAIKFTASGCVLVSIKPASAAFWDSRCYERSRSAMNVHNADSFHATSTMRLIRNRSRNSTEEDKLLNQHLEGFVIVVEDTGCGIPPDCLNRIFEPFYQEDGSMTRKFGGTGLGMTIVRHLVDRMDGTVHLRSSVGVGTIVSCLICVPKLPEQPLPLPSWTQILHQFSEQMSVLIAMGYPFANEMLKRELLQFHHHIQVDVVTTVEQVRLFAQRKQYSVVFVHQRLHAPSAEWTLPFRKRLESLNMNVDASLPSMTPSTGSPSAGAPVFEMIETDTQLSRKSFDPFAYLFWIVDPTFSKSQKKALLKQTEFDSTIPFPVYPLKLAHALQKIIDLRCVQQHRQSKTGPLPTSPHDGAADENDGPEELILHGNSGAPGLGMRKKIRSRIRNRNVVSSVMESEEESLAWKDNIKLLLVEDQIVNQKVIAAIIERVIECTLTVVNNGLEAVAVCHSEHFDLILMDCQMPIMDGYEATREIRANSRMNRDTTIIALTAHAMSEDRNRCSECGMDDYLTKPLERVRMKQILANYLSVRSESTSTSQLLLPARSQIDPETLC